MKLTTGALDGNNETTPKTGMVLQVEATDISSLLIFSDCFSIVLHLGSVSLLGAWGYTWTLQRFHMPSKSSRDGTSMRAIARRFAMCPSTVSRAWRRFQETGSYSRRAGQGHRRYIKLYIKGMVHPKMKILSFTHPQVVPNLYECLCSAEWVNDDRIFIFWVNYPFKWVHS